MPDRKAPSQDTLMTHTSDQNPMLLINALAYGLYWVDESLQATLTAAGWQSLNRTQSMIMLNLASGISRPAKLARNIGVSRQAIHQMLQEMSKTGLIEMREDPDDKRAKMVVFSKTAKALRSDAIRALKAIEDELVERIGARSVQQLKTALGKDFGPIYAARLTTGKRQRR